MNTVYYDPPFSDEERRQKLYDGQLIVLRPTESSLAFCRHARALIEEAFAPLDPQTAQHNMQVEKYVQILGQLKPTFIHHAESKRHMAALLQEAGCDLEKTYYEVPKLRSSTSGGYLTAGIAYAWHPHRDTWTAALPCQINWWIPIYELRSDNGMTFYPQYWNRHVRNTSSGYNYYQWNKEHRGDQVLTYIKEDPRPIPRPTEELDLESEIRLICPVGGIVLFSAAQLHASVENTSGLTRFSFDFRTVHLEDIAAKRGAPNIDSRCEGHMLRDYIRPTDLAHVPDEYMALYDDGTEMRGGELVYQPAQK
jgi:hypothetical protein